jgi:hypothetical protein
VRGPESARTALIELNFSPDNITILDREGQAQRGQRNPESRFDSLPAVLRAVGEYIDSKRAHLRRLNNCCLSDQDAVEVEYQTRAGDVRSETLSMNAIRETAVNMYKRRTRLSNPIDMVTH